MKVTEAALREALEEKHEVDLGSVKPIRGEGGHITAFILPCVCGETFVIPNLENIESPIHEHRTDALTKKVLALLEGNNHMTSFSEFRDGDYVKASVVIPGRAPVEMKGYLAQIGSELVLGHAVVRTVDGEQGPEILSIELAPRELSWEEFSSLPAGARFKDKDGEEWVVEKTGCRKTDAYFMTIVNPDWVFGTYRPITATARVS